MQEDTLYTIQDCLSCEQVVEWTEENSIPVRVVSLIKIDNKLFEETEDGYLEFDQSVHAFPVFSYYEFETRYMIIGSSGCKQYIIERFLSSEVI